MSASPGKVVIEGISEINGEKVFVLNLLQGRNPDWVRRPFFAKYDEKATWLNHLRPASGEEKFFFEDELEMMMKKKKKLMKDFIEELEVSQDIETGAA